MWGRRSSWNDGAHSSEDIPARKMKRFQSIVTQVVKTVKERKQEILDFRRNTYNQEEPTTGLDIDNFEDMIKMAHELQDKRKERSSKFFVEQAPPIKIKKKEEDPKKMMKDVLKTIGTFEKDYRKQVEEARIEVEEEEEEEELPVIEKKPPKPKQLHIPTKVIGAKIDTGLKPPRSWMIEEPLDPKPSCIIITLNPNKTSTIVGLVTPEISRTTVREEQSEGKGSNVLKQSVEPTTSLTVIPVSIEAETVTKKPKKEIKKPQGKNRIRKIKTASSSSLSLNKMPSLEVVGLTEKTADPKKSYLKQQDQQKKVSLLEDPTHLTPAESTLKSSSLNETVDAFVEDVEKTNEPIKILEEAEFIDEQVSSSNINGDRRLARTAEHRRFSKVKKQPNTSFTREVKPIQELETMAEEGSQILNINPITLKSMVNHQYRISGSWKENERATLYNKISTLPAPLRAEYIRNYLNNGKQGDVFKRVQDESMAIKRLQIAHIMAEATRREDDVKTMREMALDDEIAILEDRARRSTPSIKVKEEETKRQKLKKYYKDYGIINSKEYWRQATKGQQVRMKEFIPETTFESILNQRGFFGRKAKRTTSVIYVPLTTIQSDKVKIPQGKKDVNKITSLDFESSNDESKRFKILPSEEKKGKWEIVRLRLLDIINMKKLQKDTQPGFLIKNDLPEAKMENLQDINEVKPILFNPFNYRTPPNKGKIRIPGSQLEVSAKEKWNATKERMKITQRSKFEKESESYQIPAFSEPEANGKRISKSTSQKTLRESKHRFANKTNKGFMKEFTEIYDGIYKS